MAKYSVRLTFSGTFLIGLNSTTFLRTGLNTFCFLIYMSTRSRETLLGDISDDSWTKLSLVFDGPNRYLSFALVV